MPILETTSKGAAGARPGLRDAETLDDRGQAHDPRWQLAQKIAASPGLRRSRLLQDFLLYVVDRELAGRTDDITEQLIGVSVFGRPAGYDSSEDNIVRAYARNLRKRVDEYYSGEGSGETLRLEIPRGGYAPVFRTAAAQQESEPELEPETEPEPGSLKLGAESTARMGGDTELEPEPAIQPFREVPTGPQGRHRFRGIALAMGVGILIGITATYLAMTIRTSFSPQEALAHLLWQQIFSSKRDTFLVPCDDGLVIMQGLTPRPLPLAEYVNGGYRLTADLHAMPGGDRLFVLGARRFTSVAGVDLVARLAQLKEVVPGRLLVRYARDLRMDDLRSGNAVLIGSDEANPWIDLFQPRLPFRYCFDCTPVKREVISNVHPRPGEQAIYVNNGDDNTYGIIAFLPNLNATGNVLIVAGLNMAGTQAAATFLMDQSLMMPMLRQAKMANGTIRPFEILVDAGNIATNASTPHAVIERVGLLQ